MLTGIFDTHAHYDDPCFEEDRDVLLASMSDKGVARIVNVGSNLEWSRVSVKIAEKFDFVYASVGVHPDGADKVPGDYLEQLADLSKHPKVVALGEIGLDYYYGKETQEEQRKVFRQQLALAKDLNLPVIIHDRDAHGETLDLLREFRPKGIVHCFSGSAEMATEVAKLGMYVGFTGVVTFKNARKALEAVAALPVDRILLETDCPYMAPVPFRGKRCDSSMLPQTAQAIAQIKRMDPQALVDATYENGCRVYNLSR